MRLLLAACLALAGLVGPAVGPAWAEVPIPPLSARVIDLTGTLSAQQKSELEARIAAFEAKRGSQIAVLMLPTTKPEEIEQFSIRLAEAWKVGRKKVDDGLILVVAKDDRRVRIEVGYGLEGAIPDALARRVIDERITPRFKAGDFHGGIRDGVEQLIRLVEGEKLPAPAARGGRDPVAGLFEYAVPALFFIVIGGGILKLLLGRFAGSIATGALLGLAALLLVNLVAAGVVAVLGFLFAFANTGTGRGGGWSSGGSSGSFGSGGGSFGGGGGSFGGGGASGRW